MIRPTSTSHTSPSSSLARSFLSLLGVTPSPSRVVRRSPVKAAIEAAYSEKVREYARTKPGWDSMADLLYVNIEDGKITIKFDGSEEDQLLINALEYGTPGNPPNSVIRVMEETLKQDYLLTKQRFSA